MRSFRSVEGCRSPTWWVAVAVFAWGCSAPEARAQGVAFVGAAGGVSTLSADARSRVGPRAAEVSVYKPENGPALNLFAGIHLSDYVSVQGNYVWNRNDLTLTSSILAAAASSFYEQSRESTQHAVIADLLVYFRDRRSAVRPYLSAGLGAMHLNSTARLSLTAVGTPVLPPRKFTATGPVMRVAVGIDLGAGTWRFRYSFSETLSRNTISAHLSPPGARALANFQNLFGVVKAF